MATRCDRVKRIDMAAAGIPAACRLKSETTVHERRVVGPTRQWDEEGREPAREIAPELEFAARGVRKTGRNASTPKPASNGDV
jgi:hypothetical protein